MRTTVDLPPAVHRRAKELAARRGISLSALLAELTTLQLSQADETPVIGTDPLTGFPTVHVGRVITSDEVADLLDDE